MLMISRRPFLARLLASAFAAPMAWMGIKRNPGITIDAKDISSPTYPNPIKPMREVRLNWELLDRVTPGGVAPSYPDDWD